VADISAMHTLNRGIHGETIDFQTVHPDSQTICMITCDDGKVWARENHSAMHHILWA